MYSYNLYGLCLRSAWPLDYGAEGESDSLTINLVRESDSFFAAVRPDETHETKAQNKPAWFSYRNLQDGSVYMKWTGLFEFLISTDGRQIAGQPLDEAHRESFLTYLLGQVLSVALLKLGIDQLHAAVVVIENKAVAFIGDSGYGKSSLTAAFLRAGFPLLTDDLLIMRNSGDLIYAYPGPPRIKLFPEVAKELLDGLTDGVPMNNLTPKLIVPLRGDHYYSTAAPLAGIFALAPPQETTDIKTLQIRTLSQQDGFLELVKNTYNALVVDSERLKKHFAMMTHLASRVPIKELSYPREMRMFPGIIETVLSEIQK